MTFTLNQVSSPTTFSPSPVADCLARYRQLSTDDKLGLLWVLYENMGGQITPAAPGAARVQFIEGLLNRVKAMSQNEQLTFMRDLVNRVSTPDTRAYGVLTNNNKLAFWYLLAVAMDEGDVIPMPRGYKLSNAGSQVFTAIAALEFNQQITLMRQAVIDMGVDPLR